MIHRKIIYICYNFDFIHFLTEPDPNDRFYTYGFSGKYARKFKHLFPDYEVEVWRLDGNIKKYFEKKVEGVFFRIFPAVKIPKVCEISLKFLLELKKEVRKNNPILNISHVHYWLLYQVAFLFNQASIVAQHHGEYSPFFKFNNYKGFRKLKAAVEIRIEKLIFKNLAHFFILDIGEIKYIKKIIANPSYSILGSGVDFSEMVPISKEEARNKLGLHQAKKYLLYVGKLYNLKQADILIEIWNSIKKERPDIELILIGNSPNDEFYNFAVESGAQVLGRKLQKDLYNYYSASDVYVLMAFRDDFFGGIGMAPVESLACNTPVVSLSLINYPGKNIDELGEVPKTIVETKNAILKVLDNPCSYKNMRESVKNYYSWEYISKTTEEIYKKITKVDK